MADLENASVPTDAMPTDSVTTEAVTTDVVTTDAVPVEAGQQVQRRGGGRPPGGGREAGSHRDSGGLRIRLSENEQRAAKVVQEAFQLRSTIAALGFSIRTVAQLLEQGALDALVAEMRSQAGNRPERSRPEGGRPEGGRYGEGNEGRRGRRDGSGEGRSEGRGERRVISRPDPFARPSRPEPVREPAPVAEASAPEVEPALADDAAGTSSPHTSDAEVQTTDAETQP